MPLIFIQNALNPNFIFSNGEFIKESIKEALEKISIDKNTVIFINKGPGSYTGIRLGIAFGMAISQLNAGKVVTYTSFDFINFIAKKSKKNSKCIFIQSWPRLERVALDAIEFADIKGYTKCGNNLKVMQLNKLPAESIVYIPSTDFISKNVEKLSKYHLVIPQQLLVEKNILDFANQFNPSKESALEPLYINPVAITTKPRK